MATFTFDGRDVPLQDGDTLGSALHRHGVKVLSRSLKYHRPRGLFCCVGSCASCFVEVDGVANVPACMRPAEPGAVVRSQNRMGSAKHDLLGVVDKVYAKGFDPHNAFTKPRVLNQAFLGGVRFMSGVGRPPRQQTPLTPARRFTMEVDELVVGAGASGLSRARAASQAGQRVLLVDELDSPGGSARWNPQEADVRLAGMACSSWPGVTAWMEAVCFGLYPHDDPKRKAAGRPPLAAIRRRMPDGAEDLWEVSAGRITLACGAHDAWPIFDNNDLPGILSARGAARLFGEHHVVPGHNLVVHGGPIPGEFAAQLEAAGCRFVAHGVVTKARGTTEVTSARVGGRWVDCDAILSNVPGTPRIELYQQAGCALSFRSGALDAKVGPDGATTVPGVFAARPAMPDPAGAMGAR